MTETKPPPTQLFGSVPVVFAAVLGVLVGTQISLVGKINSLEERAERMASIALSFEQRAGATPVTCVMPDHTRPM